MREDIKRLNERLQKHMQFEIFGFELLNAKENYFEYQRIAGDKVDYFLYAYSKDKWGDDTNLISIDSRIYFPIINKILIQLPSAYKLIYTRFYLEDATINFFPNYDKKVDEYGKGLDVLKFIKGRVFNEQVFEEAMLLFKRQFETTVLPFFDKIQTLQQVNDEILEKYEWLEWSKYISGQIIFKALIIMKLCNNEAKFKEFGQFYKERINYAIQEGHKEYQDLYNTLVELLNFLESGKYLEVI